MQTDAARSPYAGTVRRPEVEAARRAQIIAAARACIARQGYDATTIRDVALASGVSTGTVNYYFSSKEALLVSALEDVAADFGRRVRDAAHGAGDDAFAALVALVEATLPLPEEAPHAWYLWLEFWGRAYRHAGLSRIHVEVYRDWRRLIAETIERGVAAHQLRPVDATAVARQLAGLIDGLAIHCIVGDSELPVSEVRRLCLDFLRTTVQPREGDFDGE